MVLFMDIHDLYLCTVFTMITRHRKISAYQKLTALSFVLTKVGVMEFSAVLEQQKTHQVLKYSVNSDEFLGQSPGTTF